MRPRVRQRDGAAAAETAFGLTAGKPTLDLARTVAWKEGIVGRLTGGVAGLLKKAGVKIVVGTARFRDGKTVVVETETGVQAIRAEHVVIATGSAPVELPALPFGGAVISSTEALSLTKLPKSLAVVGAGYIGLELGTAFAKLGAGSPWWRPRIAILPLYDAELSRPVARRLAELGVEVLTGARGDRAGGARQGAASRDRGRGGHHRAGRHVLVTVGRRPLTEGWGLEELALDMAGPFVRIDDQCRTSMRGIFAIGDVTGEPMLAHRAMAQGEMVAEIVAGHPRSWDKRAIPAVCFTDPEIVSVGPVAGGGAGAAAATSRSAPFPLSANGRAMTLGATDGFVRVGGPRRQPPACSACRRSARGS